MSDLPTRALLASYFRTVSKTQHGFAEAVAESSGVTLTQQNVNQWLQRERVPANRCAHIVKASNGAVTLHQLRPDVFPTGDGS
ncbi:MAG: helix-turn-helix domain-containing protein [Planctomycetes bacterium]|nr:helix-turn-helix domain-containing protein [Planctomycetota bacterium]